MKMHETFTCNPICRRRPYSKLIRYPALTEIWARYPFSADYNAKEVMFFPIRPNRNKRNDKEWLNKHGFPAFKGNQEHV